MKNIVLFLGLLFVTVCNAQIVEKNNEGRFRLVVDEDEWQKTDISADEKTRYYTGFFPKAIELPGTPILVERSEKIVKLKPLLKKVVEVEEYFIVYDDVSKRINYLALDKKSEEASSIFLLPGIIAFLLFTVGVTFYFYQKKVYSPVFGFVLIFSFFAYISAIIASEYYIAAVMGFLSLLFSALFFMSIRMDGEYVKIKLFLYYVFTAAYFTFMFIGV